MKSGPRCDHVGKGGRRCPDTGGYLRNSSAREDQGKVFCRAHAGPEPIDRRAALRHGTVRP